MGNGQNQPVILKAPLSLKSMEDISAAFTKDELVVLPTETVYGLAANAFSDRAIRAIFAAKKRPMTNPVIVHIASMDMLDELTKEIPPIAYLLADAFWPGPLTMIFKKSHRIPDAISAGTETVGIRIPAFEITRDIIKKVGPLAAPSANIYTELSPTSVEHLSADLLRSVTYIVDGGTTQVGIESTVLSVVDNIPILLRPGMISKTEIEKVIVKKVYFRKQSLEDKMSRSSPGLSKRHYAPKTPVFYTIPTPDDTRKIAFIFHTRPCEGRAKKQVQLSADPSAYAEKIYALLHELDEGFDAIFVEPLPTTSPWDAIRDRIQRATETR